MGYSSLISLVSSSCSLPCESTSSPSVYHLKHLLSSYRRTYNTEKAAKAARIAAGKVASGSGPTPGAKLPIAANGKANGKSH